MKKKDMDFLQLSDKSDISFFGDADKDKVPNVFDCKPFDPDQDGLFGRAVNVLSLGRFGQSKQDYESEKISKVHFERDTTGKVIKITEDGKEIEPFAKSVNQLLKEQQVEKYRSALEKQKAANALIKQRIALQKLKGKQQQLKLIQRLQSQQQPSPARQAFFMMAGIPDQPRGLQRPGYYIESSGQKLPRGFRWKKLPKSSKKGSKKTTTGQRANICPMCGTPMMVMPGLFGTPMLRCPRCGTA